MAHVIVPPTRGIVPVPVTKGGVDLRLWTMELVHNGAVMRRADLPPMIVGELRWVSWACIAWFPAFGERPEDAHCVTYDAFQIGRASITFFRRGIAVTELIAIEAAGLDDPDDYQIGWQLWLQVVPLRRAYIERCFATLLAGCTCPENRAPAELRVLSDKGSAKAARAA